MNFNFSDRLRNLSGNAIREIFKVISKPDMISFAGGLPATQCLPVELIDKFCGQLLKGKNAAELLQYGATEGYMPLRTSMIKYLERTGIAGINEDNILIISGGQQGIDLSFKAFVNEGDCILVENPTYLAALHIAKMYRAKTIGIASENDGIDVCELEKNIIEHKPKVFYVVPNFSNPAGRTLSLNKRKQIADMASKYNIIVVEDDPYRELRYSGEHLPAIKSFDKTGNVIYVTSFSKVVSPALRVGAAVASKEVIAKLTIGKQGTDVHTVTLSQAVVNEFISTGTLDGCIKKSLPVYREKRDNMVEAIKKYMPSSFKYTFPDGGLFIWGEFEDGTDTAKYLYTAIENNVAYVTGQDFYANGGGGNCLRLNFSNASNENIEKGIKELGKIFSR